jgi:Zn-dependent protease with chaperone function
VAKAFTIWLAIIVLLVGCTPKQYHSVTETTPAYAELPPEFYSYTPLPPEIEPTPSPDPFVPKLKPQPVSKIHPACPMAISNIVLPAGWTKQCVPGGTSIDGYADVYLEGDKVVGGRVVVSADLTDSTDRVYFVARHEAGHAWCVELYNDFSEQCANNYAKG